MKTSYKDRLKITKNGKIKRGVMGTGHTRAKQNGNTTRAKRKTRGIDYTKIIKKLKSLF